MTENYSYRPFVIIGTARTGSTLLWSYLNSHPDVLCLRGVYGSTHKINFGKFYNSLPEEHYSSELVNHRNENPLDFLKEYIFKTYSGDYKAIGFKYFYEHDRHLRNKNELVNYFQENNNLVFIHLIREQLLATLFSYKRALAQQQWTTADTDFKTAISIQECKVYFQSVLERRGHFDKLFSERSIRVIYENFITNKKSVLNDVLQFIGAEPSDLKTEMIRNKNKRLSEVITNFDELKGYFENSVYEQYFDIRT